MTQTSTPTQTFHQPTTGTAASLVATCGTCGRGISRQNGGSALWIDAEGKTSCTPKVTAPATKLEFPADIEVKVGADNAPLPISLVATDDNPSHLGTWKITEAQAERLMRALAEQLGYSVGMVNAVRCEYTEHGEQAHPLRDDCLHPHLI